MNHKTIMVVGCGVMGSGIAQTFANADYEVMLYDAAAGAATQSKERIATTLDKSISKGRLDVAKKQLILDRISIAETIAAAGQADVIIEAVREELTVKQAVFAELEKHANPQALLLSNTSMISITEIAQNLQHPQRVAGCHFFNPAPRMKLVEIISGERTSQQTLEAVHSLVASLGKTAVQAPNSPGFIVNRILFAMLNEAAILASEGTPYQNIDDAMKLGCNFPMGPLELMDLIGIDVSLECLTVMWEEFGHNPRYAPCPLLREMVKDSRLGRKSRRGFYEY